MRKMGAWAAAGLAAAALVGAGVFGAYSYARNYAVHRGFSRLVQLRRAGTGRLEAVHFYSRALDRSADYLVYLPPHYNPHDRYPVYYLLHGAPSQPKVFVDIANMDVRLDNQLTLGHARPMILVYPDGRIGGSTFSDSEWANTGTGGAYESYVIELMHDVDQRFSTIPRRQDRVIAGFSEGAYGAMNIALHHLADFANVQAWSGYFVQTRTGVFAHSGGAALAYNSPLEYVSRLRGALRGNPLRVYMFVGRDDPSSRQQAPMAIALRTAGAQVAYRFYPGGHDWSVWYPHLNQMLDLASLWVRHPPTAAAAVGRIGTTTPAAPAAPRPLAHRSSLRLLAALMLALVSAALINLGFGLQHRGHAAATAAGRGGLAAGCREPAWLLGQFVGWAGFGGQIVAVALAPLTLVQAFSTGGLALSVPVAARLLGHRVGARQLAAIAIIAVSLVSLPIGFGAGHGHLYGGLLIAAALLVMLTGGLVVPRGGEAALAVAAGAFYGAADGAIKAASIAFRFQGAGILTGWTLLAALCTLGGFLAFQAALQKGDAVQPLSLMNAFTALTAAALGIAAFGESLGANPAAAVMHSVAILAVLVCVRPLAGAQQQLAGSTPATDPPASPVWRLRRAAPVGVGRALRGCAVTALGAAALIICCLAALGLLYEMRRLGWFALGPRVQDALPLLQLAGFAAQPLVRVMAASLLAGLVLSLVMVALRVEWRRRVVLIGIFGLFLLLAGSDASYALARNLRLNQVLLSRAPGLGPWIEALVLVAGSAALGPLRSVWIPSLSPRIRDRRILAPALAGAIALTVAGALALPGAHARTQLRPVRLTRSSPPGARLALSPAALSPAALRPARPANVRRAVSRPAFGRLFKIDFYSRALRRRADYLVYLPADYRPGRRLPVFYMLHGMPGRPLAFTVNASVESKLERLIAQHRVSPMILVFPDGRIDGNSQTDSEWANTAAGRYESYVVNVVHDVDHRFDALPYRQDRAIAGLSSGAYGAANIGLHHVSLFGLIQVWSGYFTQTRTGVFARASRAQVRYNSPLDYARAMKRALGTDPLRVFLYVGSHDPDRAQIKPMAAALAAAGVDVHYAIYPGGHSWVLWSSRIDQMLIMASRGFAGPPTPPGAATLTAAA